MDQKKPLHNLNNSLAERYSYLNSSTIFIFYGLEKREKLLHNLNNSLTGTISYLNNPII